MDMICIFPNKAITGSELKCAILKFFKIAKFIIANSGMHRVNQLKGYWQGSLLHLEYTCMDMCYQA